MDITGTLKAKGKTEQVSEKFRKRDFVITDNSSQYPQHITFQLTQDKCDLLDKAQVGDEMKVYFNLRGREWVSKEGEVKHFNTLEAWKIELTKWNRPVEREDIPDNADFGSREEEGLPF